MDKKIIKKASKFIIFTLTILCCNNVFAQQDFLLQQKKYPRVKTAFSEKEQSIAENLRKHGLTTNDVHILITAYKAEKQLEIYAKKKNEAA